MGTERDALLYFQSATNHFEDASASELAGDTQAAVASIRAGLRDLGYADQLCPEWSRGKGHIRDAIAFWTDTLANFAAEGENLAADEEGDHQPLGAEGENTWTQAGLC